MGMLPMEYYDDSHTLGSRIDISGYTSPSNAYTCPSDGYAQVINESGKQGLMVIDNASTMTIGGANTDCRIACFVKKGTKVYISGAVRVAYFAPLQ